MWATDEAQDESPPDVAGSTQAHALGMTTSLRIIVVLLALLGLERIIYADIVAIVPEVMEPMPALSMAMGLGVVIVAIGLFLGYGWARWPAVAGATFIVLQGLGYVVWGLSHSLDAGFLLGLIEPILGVLIIVRLLRHWPPGVSWAARLR
jgi:hypothetical protein